MSANGACREITASLNILAGATTTSYSAQTAAGIYAGVAGPPSYTELLTSLNIRAGNSPPNLRDLAAVCNQLAGTTNLEVQDALDRLATTEGVGGHVTWAAITSTWAATSETWSVI